MTANRDELRLHLERDLPARRALVFTMHTEPDELARWWGPKGFTVPRIALDLRTGGRYRIEMQPPEGDRFFLAGEFCDIEPPAHLSYTFRWENPDPDDRDTVVMFSLANTGDSTRVIVDQGPFLTEARRDLHAQGWAETLDRLHELLASGEVGRVEYDDVSREVHAGIFPGVRTE